VTAYVRVVATHLPPWGDGRARVAGPDEDAVTLAVAAGRAALAATGTDGVDEVVFVTRDAPLLEGGSTAVLLAGLDLPDTTRATQVLGGAPAALDALTGARPGTLVIGADAAGAAGAAAALVGTEGTAGAEGTAVTPLARSDRSLPVHARDAHGGSFDYSDARLLRERGTLAGVSRLDLPAKPVAVAGLPAKEAAALTAGPAPAIATRGASSPLFALAALVEARAAGPLLAVEQATLTAATVEPGAAAVVRHAPAPRPLPRRRTSAEADIKISLAAYERAFDAKVRLRAARCPNCGTLSLPPRLRCLECGTQGRDTPELVVLPRDAVVYTAVTVHVPVPGLATPYSLAVVELGDTGVRLLAHVTDAEPGAVEIGDSGRLVLRRVAIRAGVPDYGYAFAPAGTGNGTTGTEGGSA
jgi:uncharacterized protein